MLIAKIQPLINSCLFNRALMKKKGIQVLITGVEFFSVEDPFLFYSLNLLVLRSHDILFFDY